MNFEIRIKDINALSPTEVTEIYSRLSVPGRNMRHELEKRYISLSGGQHERITMAMVYHNGYFISWVATRAIDVPFKGDKVPGQTVECFTEPDVRQRGFALLGLQALISAGVLDREIPVAVYRKAAIKLAQRCGCKIVVLCDP